jgi:hypothetical protein
VTRPRFVPTGELRVGEPVDGVWVQDGRMVGEVRGGLLVSWRPRRWRR